MAKKNMRLDHLLEVFHNLENITRENLRKVVEEREKREYRDDVLQLSSTDVSLLTYYYMNSNEEAKKQFLDLLRTVYDDKDVKIFLGEFQNLYFLSKNHLTSTTQYGASKRVVLDFINRLKDQSLSDRNSNRKKEEELANRLFILRKLIQYFNAPSGSVEVRNIDDFMGMLHIIKVSDSVSNDALYLAIQNNNEFYNKQITLQKKSSDNNE